MKRYAKQYSIMIAIILITIIMGIVDYYTGLEIGFFVLYYIPLSLAAWFFNMRCSLIIVFMTVFAWFTSEIYLKDHLDIQYIFQNGILRIISFIFVLYVINKLKSYNERLLAINHELNKAISEIKTLKGILPICSSCKKIRNDDGYWDLVEKYIMDHSDAEFTHGLCGECAKKLYPDFYK